MKRAADALVNMGRDIQTPEELYRALTEKNSPIAYFWIPEEDVKKYDESVPSQIPVVNGTLQIHQVAVQTPGKILHLLLQPRRRGVSLPWSHTDQPQSARKLTFGGHPHNTESTGFNWEICSSHL